MPSMLLQREEGLGSVGHVISKLIAFPQPSTFTLWETHRIQEPVVLAQDTHRGLTDPKRATHELVLLLKAGRAARFIFLNRFMAGMLLLKYIPPAVGTRRCEMR